MSAVDLVVRALSDAYTDEQAAFFSEFFERLSMGVRGSRGDEGMMLLCLARELKPTARRMVIELAEFAKLENEDDDERRRNWSPTREEMQKIEDEIRKLKQQRDELAEAIETGSGVQP